MIAHVAQTGEDRGRVVLHLRSGHPSTLAVEAALRVARAFGSDLESLFVEDEQLFDCAAYGFVHEVSLSGRESRAISLDGMMRAVGATEGYCNACFTGKYPIPVGEAQAKLSFEGALA